jgi:hypothetical protein
MRLLFHGLAEQEFNDAADYYERESPGLGIAFVLEVEHCAANCRRSPPFARTRLRSSR